MAGVGPIVSLRGGVGISLVAGALLLAASAPAALVNSGFETGNLTGWQSIGQVSIVTSTFGSGPTEGTYQALLTNGGNRVNASALESFIGVPTGTLNALGNGNVTVGSALEQTFTAGAGFLVSFDWNFFTGEATPSSFNDFSFVTISGVTSTLANTHATFMLSSAPFGQETGFHSFTYLIPASGTYTIAVGVVDVGDTVVDSALLVDNFSNTCGDGVVDPGEQCDDGNTTIGDGCSACRVDPCYTCAGEPSMCAPLPDDSACDDGLFCNGTDTCAGATCSVHTGDPCTAGADCNNLCDETRDSCQSTAGTLCMDDGNVCTFDRCDGMGTCVHPENDFIPCDDGLFCNGSDTCLGGSCILHDGDPCAFRECITTCDEQAGACDPEMAGTPCSDDGLVCTSDQCDGMGSCSHPPLPGGAPCPNDGNDCTADECNGIGLCIHPALPNGTSCDDSNACTQIDQCQSGHCVGSDPVICTAPLCHAAGTCDPASGTCTSCPVGYIQGDGGCQKTYPIGVPLLDNLNTFCDGSGANRYNGCSTTPFGFHWADTGDASVGAVVRVDIAFQSGVDCEDFDHTVTLNQMTIGIYASTAAGSCDCSPPSEPQLLSDVDTSSYVKGGLNAVSIDAIDCAGLSQDTHGHYAIVTVTYADPGLPVALRTGCRQAAKSHFRYKNNANDALDKMTWKWGKGDATTRTEFGDPTTSAAYQLCIFGETSGSPTLLIGADIPASGNLWSVAGRTGYKYSDFAASEDGMKAILLHGGAAGKAKLVVNGEGPTLDVPSLPLSLATTGIRAQLTNQSNGLCWESEFPLNRITADDHSIRATVR